MSPLFPSLFSLPTAAQRTLLEPGTSESQFFLEIAIENSLVTRIPRGWPWLALGLGLVVGGRREAGHQLVQELVGEKNVFESNRIKS